MEEVQVTHTGAQCFSSLRDTGKEITGIRQAKILFSNGTHTGVFFRCSETLFRFRTTRGPNPHASTSSPSALYDVDLHHPNPYPRFEPIHSDTRQYEFAQAWDGSRNTEQVKRQARPLGADAMFETNSILRLVIRCTASVGRSDWSIACCAKKSMRGKVFASDSHHTYRL